MRGCETKNGPQEQSEDLPYLGIPVAHPWILHSGMVSDSVLFVYQSKGNGAERITLMQLNPSFPFPASHKRHEL